MAEFMQDPTNPSLVMSRNGQVVPRDALGPGDTVVAPQPAQPAPLPAAAPPVAPAAPGGAASVLAKHDAVMSKLGQPTLELAGSSETTSTQKGIAPGVLNPILDANTARAEEQAGAVKQAGEERATRREQSAMADTNAAYGRHVVSEAERQQAEQRAAIARQNELALSLQKDPEVDPGRFVKNMSTGTSILTTVLAAINGAFKGMVGQQGNDVMDILGRRIDQDLQAQREQVQSGRVRRGNLIAYFQNQGLREEAAEKAAAATSWAMLDRMVDAEKQRIAAGEDRTAADLLGEQLKAQTAQRNDELRLTLGQDRTSTQTTRTMQQKPTGSPGAAAEGFTKLLAARKAYEESGATPEQLAVFDRANGMGNMAPGGESETARSRREAGEKRTDDQGKAAGALAGLEGFAKDAGLVLGDEGYRANPDDKSLFNARQRERAGSILPGASQKLRASESAATEAFGRLQSGGVISPTEEERFRAMIGDAVTDQQLAENMNAIMRIIRPRLAAADRKASSGGAIPFPEVK